jgi:hypothetical protein
MGVGVSNPVDEATKQEIQELIKSILVTFTKEYVKFYALFLVKKLKDDAAAPKPGWKLKERPECTDDLKMGFLTKEGGIRKSWKKRFFVVRYDYTVEYYEKEEELKKAKPKSKGTMSLCGYSVNDDPNNGILNRVKKLAEKMGIDMSELPKPKEYPPFTIEIHHSRRRTYYVKAENEEQFKEWCDMFRSCCRNAYGLKNKDVVHEQAFHEAVRRTRWELGRWGWWTYGGSEDQILSDLIADQIDWVVMGRVYSKITGPWVIRNKIRDQVLKTLDTFISAAVAPSWKAMDTTVGELRPKIEPTIKEMVDPIGKLERELIDKLKAGAMSVIKPILEEHVNPHLSKIVEVIKSPMADAYTDAYKIWDEKVAAFSAKGTADEVKKEFKHLDSIPSSWDIYKACQKVDVMYEPLWAMNVIFPDIWPWSLIWYAHDDVRGRTDNAVYTFEHKISKALEKNPEATKEEGAAKELYNTKRAKVMEKFKHDGEKATVEYYAEIIKRIVFPPFNKLVIPACKELIEPVADLIPEPMKQFVDPYRLFDELINGIIDESIQVVLRA